MENEIKIGDYIRTNKGIIARITKIDFDEIDKGLKWYWFNNNTTCINKPYIVKHSTNLIDLMEVGDIFEFKEKRTHLTNKSTTKFNENYVFDIHCEDELKVIKKEIENNKIELISILTREQFNKESYKV